MPFIKLKTDLASLKFGQDRPGGGSSGQPFVEFPNVNQQISDNLVGTSVFFTDQYAVISPSSDTPKNFLDLYISNENSLDYPVRGGGLDFNVYTQTTTKLALVDKQRIQKFLNSDPRGKLFLQKQIALQFSNPKIQTGDAVFGLNEPRSPQVLENTRVFNNGINLLTQVGLSGTGAHLKRHGMFPINPLEKDYAATVLNQPASENRLVLLSGIKLATTTAGVTTMADLNARALAAKLGLSYNRNLLFSYLGGPGSVYGVGATEIKRTEDTTTLSSPIAMSYDQIMSKAKPFAQGEDKHSNGSYAGSYLKTSLGDVVDYRKNTENASNAWGGKNGTGTLKDTLVYNFFIKKEDGKMKDKMNLSNLIYFDNFKKPWEISDTTNSKKDIIKFVFEAIDNNSPSNSIAIFFRAFLTSMSDSHQASINSFKYLGRAEDFYTYQGVSRNISFAFKIAAFSRDELQPLYKKLNHLISQVYPDYSSNNIMRAPLIRLTIGDYFHRVAGLLESVNVDLDPSSPWEIDSIEDGTTNGPKSRQLPFVLNVSCTFKPIQDFLPRRETKDDSNVPFITEYLENGNWLDLPIDMPYAGGNDIAQMTEQRKKLSDVYNPSTNIKPASLSMSTLDQISMDISTNVSNAAVQSQFVNSATSNKIYSSNTSVDSSNLNPLSY